MNETKGLNLVVLVSGRGTNLQAILDAIQQQKIKSRVIAVVSNRPQALALERARKLDIPTVTVLSKDRPKNEFHQELLEKVQRLSPDLIVLAGFMRILPEEFINSFPNKIINIHPSLLPAFPGLNAHQQALDAGVKLTGCTVHFVDKGCDTGPIILQESLPILEGDDENSLATRLLKVEHQTLITTIKLLEDDKVVLQKNKTLLRNDL